MPNTRAGTANPNIEMENENQPVTMQALMQVLQAMQATAMNNQNQNKSNASFEKFNSDEETFKDYQERLENFFALRNVPEEKKSLTLWDSIGAKHFKLLSSLLNPEKPNNKSYAELVDILSNHLCPEPNEVSEQHKFGAIQQKEMQSVADYIAELKKAATSCKFMCESCHRSTLNTHLRSQFIRGIFDSDIREKLLMERNISFDDAQNGICY